jgi:hypothetical protein
MIPEQKTREQIDKQLGSADWAVQSAEELNITAARVAVREFSLETGFTDKPPEW